MIGTGGQASPEPVRAAFYLGPLTCLDRRQLRRAHPGHGNGLVGDDPHTAFAQCAHRELRLARRAQLTDDDHIKRCAQGVRNACGDRHAPPGQPEDDDVLAFEVSQPLAKAPARIHAVQIPHQPSHPNLRKPSGAMVTPR